MRNHTKSRNITDISPRKKNYFFRVWFLASPVSFSLRPRTKKTWLRKRNAFVFCIICPSHALPSVFSGWAPRRKGKVFYLICSGLVEDQVLVRSHVVQFPLCVQKCVGRLIFHKGQKYPGKKIPTQQRRTSLFGPANRWGKGIFANRKKGKM